MTAELLGRYVGACTIAPTGAPDAAAALSAVRRMPTGETLAGPASSVSQQQPVSVLTEGLHKHSCRQLVVTTQLNTAVLLLQT